jgi:hypothetical protein
MHWFVTPMFIEILHATEVLHTMVLAMRDDIESQCRIRFSDPRKIGQVRELL